MNYLRSLCCCYKGMYTVNSHSEAPAGNPQPAPQQSDTASFAQKDVVAYKQPNVSIGMTTDPSLAKQKTNDDEMSMTSLSPFQRSCSTRTPLHNSFYYRYQKPEFRSMSAAARRTSPFNHQQRINEPCVNQQQQTETSGYTTTRSQPAFTQTVPQNRPVSMRMSIIQEAESYGESDTATFSSQPQRTSSFRHTNTFSNRRNTLKYRSMYNAPAGNFFSRESNSACLQNKSLRDMPAISETKQRAITENKRSVTCSVRSPVTIRHQQLSSNETTQLQRSRSMRTAQPEKSFERRHPYRHSIAYNQATVNSKQYQPTEETQESLTQYLIDCLFVRGKPMTMHAANHFINKLQCKKSDDVYRFVQSINFEEENWLNQMYCKLPCELGPMTDV